MKTDGFCYVIPKSVRQSKTPLLKIDANRFRDKTTCKVVLLMQSKTPLLMLKTDANRFRDKTTCKVVLLCKIVILNSVRIT